MNTNKIFVSSVFALMLIASVFAVSNDAVFSSSDDVSDISEITDNISASDIVESEEEIEADRVTYTKRTISSGSGWVTTGNNGALASIHLVNGYIDSDITSKGWMKFGKLKLKLESTDSTDSKKVFSVNAGDRSVSGTLTLNKGSSYQDGFAVWTGDLKIIVDGVSYDAKVNLAIEERTLGDRKIKEQRDSSQVTATGGLELGSLYFELSGKSKMSFERIEFEVTGRDNAKGTLTLEKASGSNYVGKLKIVTYNAEGDADDKTSGSIRATLTSEGSTLYGPIEYVSDDGNSDTGNIKIAFNRDVSSSSSDDSDDASEDKNEDRSGSNSGSESRGFWKRFIEFFGA